MQKPVLAAVLATTISLAALVVQAQETQPLLNEMQVMAEADKALNAKFGRADSMVNGPRFDTANNAWTLLIERGESSALHRYQISVNETSGEVCVRELPVTDCVTTGNAEAALQAARDKRQALAEAMLHPAPDLQGVMKAVLRHQTAPGGYLASNRMPVYVSIRSPKGESAIDLSSESIRDLGDLGVKLMPGSAWQSPREDARVDTSMTMGLGIPTRRPDGDYDLGFGFWCGGTCGSQHAAVLRRDASGWRVLSSTMTMIF